MYLQSKCSTVEIHHNVNIQTDSWHNDPASMMSLCLMTLGIAGQLTRMVTWGWRYRQLNGMDRGEICAQRLTYVDQADHIIAWPNGWHPSPGPGSTGWFSSNPATIDKMNPPTTHTHTLPRFPPTHPLRQAFPPSHHLSHPHHLGNQGHVTHIQPINFMVCLVRDWVSFPSQQAHLAPWLKEAGFTRAAPPNLLRRLVFYLNKANTLAITPTRRQSVSPFQLEKSKWKEAHSHRSNIVS